MYSKCINSQVLEVMEIENTARCKKKVSDSLGTQPLTSAPPEALANWQKGGLEAPTREG
jgi:hypothetical protein